MKTFHRIVHALLATVSFVALSGAVAWAEEAAAPPPGEGSQIPPTDWGLQIWTLVTFVVLLVLLGKFAFKPIAQALDRRGEIDQEIHRRGRKTARRREEADGRLPEATRRSPQ
jgi:membrane protein implicated in regulation of membrane protease activity